MNRCSAVAFIRHLLDIMPIFEDDDDTISRRKLEIYLMAFLPKEEGQFDE